MTITINDRTIAVPESWNDLTLQQQAECYNIIMSNTGHLFDPQEIITAKRVALISRLLNIDSHFMRLWIKDCKDTYGTEEGQLIFLAEVDAIMQTADFLFDIQEDEEGNKLYQIKLGLTKCPWPHLQYKSPKKGRPKRYFAPDDELKNITLYEMAMSFSLFERYLEEKTPELATELIAMLYREPKPPTKKNRQSGYQGDRRLPLYKHETMVKKRMEKMRTLPETTKQLILFWFASCRQAIISSYPNIFTSPEQEIGERVGNDYSWGGMLLALAGGIIHMEQVSREPYQNGLIYLSWLEDQRKVAEKKSAAV